MQQCFLKNYIKFDIFLQTTQFSTPNWFAIIIWNKLFSHFKKTIFLKKCFLAQKSLNSIGKNSSKKEKTTPNFSSFLNLKSSEKWMLFLAHQKVKNPLFIVGFGLFVYHILAHYCYIIFWFIPYKLIAVHILVHLLKNQIGSYLSPYSKNFNFSSINKKTARKSCHLFSYINRFFYLKSFWIIYSYPFKTIF